MVDLLFIADTDALSKPGTVRSLYDPTAGTGGMLSIAEEHLRALNPKAELVVYGQELNPESYAICKADMLIKGQDVSNIVFGNTLSNDGHAGKTFDYGLANPPFGVEWKKVEKEVRDEHEKKGYHGRFGAGPAPGLGWVAALPHAPAVEDAAAGEGGGRIGIVLNGSPLFTGRRRLRRVATSASWIIENDLLEAIVALPTDMFYNTGISTYVWILDQPQAPGAQGQGPAHQRRRVVPENAQEPRRQAQRAGRGRHRAGSSSSTARSRTTSGRKVFDNEDFGYRTITVERPLRLNFAVSPERVARIDEAAALVKLGKELPKLKKALATTGRGQGLEDPANRSRRPSGRRWTAAKVYRCLHRRLRRSCRPCPSATRPPRSAPTARATRSRTPTCATPRTCRSRTTCRLTSRGRCCHMSRMRGSTMTRPKSATRFRSPGTSTSTFRLGALEEIDAELKALAGDIMGLLAEVTA